MKPKEFIKTVLVDQLGVVSNDYPYLAFAMMAIGIEFLGKCLDTSTASWRRDFVSKTDFIRAINTLTGFQRYRGFDERLYKDLRNGFAHSFIPKYDLTLSSGSEEAHLALNGTRLNLKCEDFYQDFKDACLEVINLNFSQSDKMNSDLLEVPDPNALQTAYNLPILQGSSVQINSINTSGSTT